MADNNKNEPFHNNAKNKGRVSRRNFLFLTGSAAAASFLPVVTARAAVNNIATSPIAQNANFLQVSQFLTEKELSSTLAKRAWAALEKDQENFSQNYEALHKFIVASKASNIDEVKDQSGFTPDLRKTALSIISAYYLGYVGTPQSLRAHDDTIFISYTHAVMHQFHYEYVPIPTYSRWDEGYWAAPTPHTH